MNELAILNAALSGKYELTRAVGSGGMATVYLARDIRHDRNVAIKVLRPELGAVLGVERFLAEIRVTANLQHPNLLPLFDSGEAAGLLYYVMPFVEGESLRQRLDREHELPVDEVLRLGRAISGALEYAHAHGVVHRDLKPENILLQAGEPVVADFGIALAVSNAGGERITQTGLSLGTPQYMSPEQAAGDRNVDARSDVYSLASVLYETLVGEPPHAGPTVQAIIAKVLTEPAPAVRTRRPSVPASADAAIQKALAKVPADRFASAREFADALTAPASPHEEKSPSRGRRRPPSWVVALAAGLAGIAIGAAAIPHKATPRRTVRSILNLDPADQLVTGIAGSSFALSPDGATAAFVGSDSAGTQRIYLRRLDELVSRAIPGTEDGVLPAFSPDGKWLAFHSRGQVKRVSIDGRTLVSLAEVGALQGLTWAPAPEIVVSDRLRLLAIRSSDGKTREIAAPDSASGEASQRWPVTLADGRTVLYTSFPSTGLSGARIAVASLSGDRARVLDLPGTAPLGVVDGTLIYGSPNGGLFAVTFDPSRGAVGTPRSVVPDLAVGPAGAIKAAMSSDGSLVYSGLVSTNDLVLLDAHGGVSVLVAGTRCERTPTECNSFESPSFSADGRRIAMGVQTGPNRDIWIYDIGGKSRTRLTNQDFNDRPAWSSDGSRIAFVSRRLGKAELWWRRADAGAPAERLLPSKNVEEAELTPDGLSVVYSALSKGTSGIWSSRLSGDTTSTPIEVAAGVNAQSPRISPDGRWVAYVSNESGVNEIYVRSLHGGGGRVQVSSGGGVQPAWSRDGRRVYYAVNRRWLAADVDPGATFVVKSRQLVFEAPFWLGSTDLRVSVAADGAHFLMVRPSQEARVVYVHDLGAELAAKAASAAR